MKPIKLTIEGLNSFETKQELDFQSLTGGVFGIFGKTGSGKSSILDAITLSLYGKVERTKQNIDFINTKHTKATVTFEFAILISGSTKTYEITRTFSKKKNGKDIDSSAELYEIDGENKTLIEEGTNKVNDKIFHIIGLGVNEFAKCIALPQGEFSAFLQAKPSERTEIMSNIFGLERYGDQLAIKVKEKQNEFDKQVAILSSNVNMVSYATDEKLENITHDFESKKQEYDEKSARLQELSISFGEQKQTFEKLKNLENIQKQLEELYSKKAQIEQLQKEIDKSQSANQIKGDYEKLKNDEEDINELQLKIADYGEQKLQKQSLVVETENSFNILKDTFDSKIIELNGKFAKLDQLVRFEEQLKEAQAKKAESENQIELKKKEITEETQNNNYIDANLSKLQDEIDEIDDFIGSNKADVELSYALEQTKGVESEIILIDDILASLESLIDQTNQDIKNAREEYNEAIAQEKKLHENLNKIDNSIGVAFEDSDSTTFNKIRSCDKQLEGMRDVKVELDNVDKLISKLTSDNDSRQNIISQIENKLSGEQASLSEIENKIEKKELEINDNLNEREELLGENVISMISEHLEVGDSCPVCSSMVSTKIYSEKNDFSEVDEKIKFSKTSLKNLQYERDKIIANIVSLKSRIEFEKAQIEKNNEQISVLFDSKSSLYLRFVDNSDDRAENFEKFYSLIENTVSSLENLIDLQDKVRADELLALTKKTQTGTRITLFESYLESLSDMRYDFQTKRAEREFVIMNVNEKYKNLAEYKKQIADGKNIEIVIDNKKEMRAKLKDQQFELASEKSKSDLKLANINAEIDVLTERHEACEKTIFECSNKILASGVPEGISVENEKEQIEKQINDLKIEYAEKQSLFETSKEELRRIENDYQVSNSILEAKTKEVETLTLSINKALEENEFKNFAELEKCFSDSSSLKLKQEKVNDYNDNCRILETQKQSLESENLSNIDDTTLNQTEKEINSLNDEVKSLTESIGKLCAELERISADNQKLKEFSTELELNKHKFDLAKELSTVLRGKALAEYVCEEYLSEITESANQKLEILMDGRYTLKFENKEFFVEDNFNDGLTRPASTLSGGETFVVSLSLALSISNAISLLSSRSMDFFFLDEGFGTLDSELCSVVISSLYKLESQNLKIGLISHVTELEESIKNKVIVTKDNNGTKLKIEHSL